MNEQEERRIIRDCQAGELGEYGRLADHYRRCVTGLARRYLGDLDEARDLAQDVFLQVMLKIHSFDPERSFKTWLSTITARRCIDLLRRRRLLRHHLETERDRILDGARRGEPERPHRRVQDSEVFAPLLGCLTSRQRQALLLHLDQGWSTREIAHRFDCSASTVRGYLFGARRALRARLNGRGEPGVSPLDSWEEPRSWMERQAS